MKKKYFILALTFLCLLMGQSSFGQNVNSDYDEDDICTNETTYFDYSQDCLDVYINVLESYYCKGGVHIDTYSYPSYVSKECGYIDTGDCTDPRSSAYPCYIDTGDCNDWRSSAYPCYVDLGDCTDSRSYAYPCYVDLGDCTDSRSYAYPCVNNDPPPCNESSTPKPSGFIASQYHFVQNSDSDCQWVPYCDPTKYWYESGICMEKYTVNDIFVKDENNRIARTGETLYLLNTSNHNLRFDAALSSNITSVNKLKWTNGLADNIKGGQKTINITTQIAVSGGVPNTGEDKKVRVEIINKKDFTNTFTPYSLEMLKNKIKGIRPLGADISISADISFSKRDFNELASDRFIKDKQETTIDFSANGSAEVLVPGYSFNFKVVKGGVFAGISGSLGFQYKKSNYTINDGNNLKVVDENEFNITANACLQGGVKVETKVKSDSFVNFTVKGYGSSCIDANGHLEGYSVKFNCEANPLAFNIEVKATLSGVNLVNYKRRIGTSDPIVICKDYTIYTFN
jgi:hypothetical protein